MDSDLRRFFQHYKVPAFILVYEDYVKFYASAVRAVLKSLDLRHGDVVLPLPSLWQQSDAESEDWELRLHDVSTTTRHTTPANRQQRDATSRPITSCRRRAFDVGSTEKTIVVPEWMRHAAPPTIA